MEYSKDELLQIEYDEVIAEAEWLRPGFGSKIWKDAIEQRKQFISKMMAEHQRQAQVNLMIFPTPYCLSYSKQQIHPMNQFDLMFQKRPQVKIVQTL